MAAGDGLISMTPTSIAYSGTSASINADGGVDFSAVTSLSLNGVFMGDYDNYVVAMQFDATGGAALLCRYRLSGTDASGATDYTRQRIDVDGTSVTGARTSSSSFFCASHDTMANGSHLYIYGPALAQPTAARSVVVGSSSGAYINDTASTHNQSTAYDGFTLIVQGGDNITGTVHVFGYEE